MNTVGAAASIAGVYTSMYISLNLYIIIYCTIYCLHILCTHKRNKCLWHGHKINTLTLNLSTTTIVAQPFNIIKWQLKFNPVA